MMFLIYSYLTNQMSDRQKLNVKIVLQISYFPNNLKTLENDFNMKFYHESLIKIFIFFKRL